MDMVRKHYYNFDLLQQGRRVTTSDNEWCGTINDNEWQRVTTNGKERQRVVQRVTPNDSE